ncbi:MAG: hypothetical protein NXI13_14045 [Proteobacteria bacterium]|nr:hypothetical protein [Pseudomonadota bacterium]
MLVLHKFVGIMVTAFLLASCAADGGTGNPLFRPFQWFSYANGDDIRGKCEPGGNARYRLIYNALYEEQVRTYDIWQRPGAKAAEQTTRVFAGGISTDWVLSRSGLDVAATHRSKEVISLDDLIAIEQALIKSGFEQPAIKGQVLHSDSFYWIAMVCRDGNFKFYAWNKRNADVAKLPFREVLSKGDKTGVDFLEPYVPVYEGRGSRYYNGRNGSTYFSMEVGNNGLIL